MVAEASKALPRGFLDVAHDFRLDQAEDFMATEFLINPDVFETVERHPQASTKLMKAVRATRAGIAQEGLNFRAVSGEVRRAMAILRRELSKVASDEAAAKLIYEALLERDPPFFDDVRL